MAITAKQLITRARQQADFVGSPYFTDATELLDWCRESYRELHDLLVENYGEYFFVTTADLSVFALNTAITSLSPLLLKCIRIEWNKDNFAKQMQRLELETVTLDYNTYAWDSTTDIRAAIVNGALMVQPIPNSTQTVRLWYVPDVTLATTAATIDVHAERWLEYIVNSLAIKMRIKEESDTLDLERKQERLTARIVSASTPRDQGLPQRAIDVRGDEIDFFDLDGGPWP